MLSKEQTAGAAGLFAVIAAFKLRAEWDEDQPGREASAAQLGIALTESTRAVDADLYISRGLKASCDYFLRVRAFDLGEAQDFLDDLSKTIAGRMSQAAETFIGVTKCRQYITPAKAAGLNEQLNASRYEGAGPRFAIVIPVSKSGHWWTMPESQRHREIEVHTEESMPYLKSVKRELYHSTGLDDVDFVTYFETADLGAFHQLSVRLAGIRENEFRLPSPRPMLMGRILSIRDAVERLCR